MPPDTLPYPLPVITGFGARLTKLIPMAWQDLARHLSDRFIGERHRLEITHPVLTIDLGPDAPKEVRIGLLADFHFDPLCEDEFVARCVATLNDLHPDVIFLLGDFASHDPSPISALIQQLEALRPPHGIYAILGNHDYIAGEEEIVRTLDSAGLRVLRNEFLRLSLPDGELAIAAMDSATYRCPDFSRLDQCGPNERAIVLCHEPDVFVHASLHPKTALQLSGHTHGGQVILPGIGSPLLPRLGKLFVNGHHRRNDTDLYVNRGIGTGHLHVRFGATPEITLMTVRNSGRVD